MAIQGGRHIAIIPRLIPVMCRPKRDQHAGPEEDGHESGDPNEWYVAAGMLGVLHDEKDGVTLGIGHDLLHGHNYIGP